MINRLDQVKRQVRHLGMSIKAIPADWPNYAGGNPNEVIVRDTVSYDFVSVMTTEMLFIWVEYLQEMAPIQANVTLYYSEDMTTGSNLMLIHPEFPHFTQHELYNLCMQRAVYKQNWARDILSRLDVVDGTSWYAVDRRPKETKGLYHHQLIRYSPFKLELALQRYPIDEIQTETGMQGILRSLERGNAHPVTFVTERQRRDMLITVNAEKKGLSIWPLYLSE